MAHAIARKFNPPPADATNCICAIANRIKHLRAHAPQFASYLLRHAPLHPPAHARLIALR
jgi:hypothetical protein